MSFRRFPTYAELSQHAAEHIAALLKRKPDALICLASGATPIGTFHQLVELAQTGHANLNQCSFIGLDEWVGMGPDDEGSCSYHLYHDLFIPLAIPAERIHYFNAKADDLAAECRRIDDAIAAHGGLDLLLVGIGLNGHIALNEPGTPFTHYCHVIDLHETTITVGQKYFTKPTPLTRGITIGLQHLMDAREVILMANGHGKAPVINQAMTAPVSTDFPATIIQRHPNAHVWVDEAAGALV
ncbi:glucosamine-6-phosphate deaminase [Arsenicibacter rosenii]|uniref:Glucosamine-6-phosphate deaminase n=1 Tax=Arsenicibacter rosenii TaxID=1750698 RepID=A0A1S2VPV6_9BACT|nr:glucosamine-6-phosphate deaminase [Arsenicibacter rosenii]OIN60799.1 glucosamine-6-phosphate deaminase [Arsenicibacter rosenii]